MWKRAIVAAVMFGGVGAAWAQAPASSVSFGPESYRLGKGVVFTLHQKLNEGLPDHLVSAYLAACDGSWVSKPVNREFTFDAGDDLRAQQAEMLVRLQRPIDGPTEIYDWSDPSAPITALRDSVMKLCKTARVIPKNLLVPVASTEVVAYSVVSSTATRKGTMVELWTEMSNFRREPMAFNGKPFIQDGKEVLHSVFTGAKTMRREIINCGNRTSAVSTAVFYESGAKDPETVNIPKNRLEFAEPVPNSIGETMVDFVCKVF
jgi:hypothetical protein